MVRDVVATNSMQAIERKGNIPRTKSWCGRRGRAPEAWFT